MATLHGSICLTDIPKELIKKVGDKMYLNIKVVEMKEPKTYGEGENKITNTHFVGAAIARDKQVEGKRYIWGGLRPYGDRPAFSEPTPQEIENAPAMDNDEELPF